MSYQGGGRDARAFDGEVSQKQTEADSIRNTLSLMQQEVLSKTNGNLIEAEGKLVGILARDRRFDEYDARRLASHVQDVWRGGKRLDMDDPVLKPGGQERPGQMRGSYTRA